MTDSRASVRRGALFLLLAFASAEPVQAASDRTSSEHPPEKVLEEIALYHSWERRARARGRLQASELTALLSDQGNLSILEDDGSLLPSANFLDLENRSLRFRRSDEGSYYVSAGNLPVEPAWADAGAQVPLGDDDTSEISLGFAFPFYSSGYRTVFLNSDGNLTFTNSDTSRRDRDLARFLTGPPRIGAFFADLDPNATGRVTVFRQADYVVFSWRGVGVCCERPAIFRVTFQAVLFADGTIEFRYAGLETNNSVIGISPGGQGTPPLLLDLSAQDGSRAYNGALAEAFTGGDTLSTLGVARNFYATHEDAYDFLVVWTNFPVSLGAFVQAFHLGIRNNTSGIGLFSSLGETFDFSREFGSRSGRLQSFVQMGDLGGYPDDPRRAFLGPNSTLSILGQEAGHRWLARLRYPFGSPQSTILLGRSSSHWSFFFHSEASVMEGNDIRDNGDGSFTTVGAVSRYGAVDQYAMGLREPGEVPPTFVVTNPDGTLSPGASPRVGVTFRGSKLPVSVDKIIEANGPRLPPTAVSQKDFNFAFILVTRPGRPPTPQEISKLDRIRTEWERFWSEITGSHAGARTALLKAARLSPSAATATPGTAIPARLTLETPALSEIGFRVQSSAPNVLTGPETLAVPRAATSAAFELRTLGAGTATIRASADGYEIATGTVSVNSSPALNMKIESGNGQAGIAGEPLRQPLVIAVREVGTGLPAAGIPVRFSTATAGGIVSPAVALTDGDGRTEASYTPGPLSGMQTVVGSLADFPDTVTFTVTVLRTPAAPPGSAVNGASFERAGTVSPGSIVSIFGTNLSSGIAGARTLPLPTSLAGTSVGISGIPAPLFFVSAGQINAQVPFELRGPSADMVVNNGAGTAAPFPLRLALAAPGIFTISQDGTGVAAALHASDGTPLSDRSPARPGEFVSVFATGLGEVSPQVLTGRPAPFSPLSRTVETPQVTIAGVPASVSFSGLAPGFVGLYQINVQVPAGLSGGNLPLVIRLGGGASNVATVAVR